ncbi:MAG: rRNA maturation RNase YbeY [Deltaproteobacteria bacterium]|nr:rRNA maturation RNase YbeY [Deltaproteobacteria bacterium]
MLRALNYGSWELSVLLCDDSTIRELNRRYRKEDQPTDVLSFSMVEEGQIEAYSQMLGDIVISVPTAIRQAAANQHAILDEITILLAHGLLHLLGFDHQTRVQKRKMQARVDMLVAAANR